MITLHITDKDGFSVGKAIARIGMHTSAGTITRLTAKSVEVDGVLLPWGKFPSTKRSYVRAEEIL